MSRGGLGGIALPERTEILATGESIARMQERSGAIAWPDGHVDAWDHVECAMALSACGLREPARRAYRWLRETQRTDGSWPRSVVAGRVTDPAAESHHAAYVAVGAWHEYLVTGDERQTLVMWPTVRRAVEWTLALRTPRGEVQWERDAGGRVFYDWKPQCAPLSPVREREVMPAAAASSSTSSCDGVAVTLFAGAAETTGALTTGLGATGAAASTTAAALLAGCSSVASRAW